MPQRDGVDEALHVLAGRLAGDPSAPRYLEAGRGDAPPETLLGAQALDQAVCTALDLDPETVATIRRQLAAEPSVTGKRYAGVTR